MWRCRQFANVTRGEVGGGGRGSGAVPALRLLQLATIRYHDLGAGFAAAAAEAFHLHDDGEGG